MNTDNWNWNEFLAKAIAGEETEDERIWAKSLSGNWVACAVGSLCHRIPRYQGSNSPLDLKLYELGLDFNTLIVDRRYEHARDCLDLIEKRAAEILELMEEEEQ